MAKKETIKITSEGLRLLTVLNYSTMSLLDSLYQKEVFFSGKFEGNVSLLFQAIGNLGAYAREKDLDKDISLIIISNKILNDFDAGICDDIITDIENKLNQNNSPYRRVRLISEDHLIWYIESRITITNDEQLNYLIQKYKDSKKQVQGTLF